MKPAPTKQIQINQHLDQIAKVDVDVKRGLEVLGYPAPRVRPPGFETLLSTVVGQQISTEAANAVMFRVQQLLPEMKAGCLLQLPIGALRQAGLSGRKVEYAEGLARAMMEGRFNPASLTDLNDQLAIESITSLRGFGPWSAEIYLMFCLDRPDVFPAADLALQVALQKLKGLQQRPTPEQARALIQHWAPWHSFGSLFLWHYYRGEPT
ncbi:MAG: DNA-3-methyladenine glycosylase II [Gammaproteobacteria bacterium]|jgi:DNA-3-methyladenine glycosylase II